MLLNETWGNCIYLHTIVEKGYTALSVDPHLSYIFNPIPLERGDGIQEGSLSVASYALGIPS